VDGRERPSLAAADSAEVRVVDTWHRFRDFVALRGVSLHVQPGEFVTLLGPSGSGKTTLLRIIAGLVRPTAGRVLIGGRDVTRLPADKRSIGFVFQNYALFPHLTVFGNVAFPLKLRRTPGAEISRRVRDALDLVRLGGLEERYPAQLSGGQQQRVALARGIVFNPSVLLMDEPLGSLDKRLRQQLQLELRRLQRELSVTTIYVTHDQEEAFSMSDRIAVMSGGEIRQFDEPEAVYKRPSDYFVANFVGDLNYFQGELLAGPNGTQRLVTSSGLEIRVASDETRPAGVSLLCGIRPEKLHLGDALDTANRFPARVRVVSFRGRQYWADLALPTGDAVLVVVPEGKQIHEGEEVSVGWNVEEAHVFEAGAQTGEVSI
jgi:spermidine/putrescine ABC transporter ATP-binding subunit